MFSRKELIDIMQLLRTEGKKIIVTHHNPDGDAIGSGLGLKIFFANMGIDVKMIVPNDFPKFLKWMPEAKKILIAEYREEKISELIRNASVIFCLDFNSLSRIGILQHRVTESRAKKILIDHHQQPDIFDYTYSDPSLPATGQMVYHFIEALGDEKLIDIRVAECLYAAIMSDTGGFRFRSTSPSTHRIVASLIEKGVSPELVSSNILDNDSIQRIQLLSLVLGKMEIFEQGNVAILHLTRDELMKHDFQKGDTEGFVNYGLKVSGVKISAFFAEDLHEDCIKISFRSKGDFDMNVFSRKYFNGGGHINASGGKSIMSMEDTVNFFKKSVKQHFFEETIS